MKNIRFFFSENFPFFLVVKYSIYLNWRVFVMSLLVCWLLQLCRCVMSSFVPQPVFAAVGRMFFVSITKPRLYNFDPLQPHFYIVKLGFTEV